MERAHLNAVSISADQLDQALAHGLGSGVGIGEAQQVSRRHIALRQDIRRAQAQKLRFSRAGPRYHQQRAVKTFNRLALLGIQLAKCRLQVLGNAHPSFLSLSGLKTGISREARFATSQKKSRPRLDNCNPLGRFAHHLVGMLRASMDKIRPMTVDSMLASKRLEGRLQTVQCDVFEACENYLNLEYY